MSSFVLTPQASADLEAIAMLLVEDGRADGAKRLVERFLQAFRLISDTPGIGHRRDDITPESEIRYWGVFSYLIAYLPDVRPIPILAIVHGARGPSVLGDLLGETLRHLDHP